MGYLYTNMFYAIQMIFHNIGSIKNIRLHTLFELDIKIPLFWRNTYNKSLLIQATNCKNVTLTKK